METRPGRLTTVSRGPRPTANQGSDGADDGSVREKVVAVLRWFGYTTIFVVSALVLHFVIEGAVTLVMGVVAPNSAQSVAGPFILVADFVLAGVVTWLIARSGVQFTRTEEDQRRGEAVLEAEHRRFEAGEQQHLDEERLQRLMGEVSMWRQARDIRAYANEALAALGTADASTSQGTSLRDELQWALTYADHIDPLRG